ncbi:MAG TPA: (2Fe-2S)-binding protein [Candidatus Acidoferrum sp.]|jgi:aerobic-type carbon monoxide dehydrogenase small subunit (CoxS/CutS family)
MSQSTFGLSVNGKKYSVKAEADTPLLFVLRDEIGLTGTKYGCGEGQCGACTVVLNGVARRSCLTPVADAVGKSITTIEGLERSGELHPVQAAFVEAGAFQCAYCTSGMIMGSVALLEKNSNPSDAEIVAGLQGNICRCGAHPRIVEAVRIAAKGMKEQRASSVTVAAPMWDRGSEGQPAEGAL